MYPNHSLEHYPAEKTSGALAGLKHSTLHMKGPQFTFGYSNNLIFKKAFRQGQPLVHSHQSVLEYNSV